MPNLDRLASRPASATRTRHHPPCSPPRRETCRGALAVAAEPRHCHITSGQARQRQYRHPQRLSSVRREAESRCSAAALGIHEPFLLGFQDGATTPAETQNAIAARLTEVFEQVRPDIVITWGPDGLTGHPDHRVASNLTTQIFQSADKLQANPRKLYYVAMPSKLMPRTCAASTTATSPPKSTPTPTPNSPPPPSAATRPSGTTEHMDEMIRMGCDLLGGIVHLRLALDAGSNAPTETSIE
ncbi:MAG: PIG-L family deacetylase [Bryobacterales bacterium]